MSYNKFQNYQEFIQKYVIDKKYSQHISFVNNKRIILVIDDSGSMNLKTETGFSRWNQVINATKIIIKLATLVDNIDIYFLNRYDKLNVSDYSDIEQSFESDPAGVTPLNKTIEKINARYSREYYHNLVVILTDGAPTNSYGYPDIRTLKQTIKYMDPEKFNFVFYSFSPDRQETNYLNIFFDLPFVYKLDYYYEEKKNLKTKFGPHYNYSFGDHIVRGLLFPYFPKLKHIEHEKKGKCIIL